MAFKDMRLPIAISMHATGGPAFSTSIVAVQSGGESANQNWSQELGAWEIGYSASLQTQWSALLSFFRVAAGRANTWRFRDWLDYSASTGEGVFQELTPTTFQMYRRYTVGAYTYDRKITKPVSGAVTVTGGSSPSVAASTGIVTVSSGTPTAWAGQYDVHARFDIDRPQFTILDKSASGGLIVEWASIPVLEVRD